MGKMREKPDKQLTPVELFRRGIEITREIRGRIEEARAYYLGRSSREPEEPLSEVFDPTRGPILKYFVETIRMINRTQFIERFCRTAAFREFRQASEATLEELRLLAIQLAMCLGVPDKTDRRRSVGQALNNPTTPKSSDGQPDTQPTNRRIQIGGNRPGRPSTPAKPSFHRHPRGSPLPPFGKHLETSLNISQYVQRGNRCTYCDMFTA